MTEVSIECEKCSGSGWVRLVMADHICGSCSGHGKVPANRPEETIATHYVHFNGAGFFVKEAAFFGQQGGLIEPWGKAWKPVVAESIEHARVLAAKMPPTVWR